MRVNPQYFFRKTNFFLKPTIFFRKTNYRATAFAPPVFDKAKRKDEEQLTARERQNKCAGTSARHLNHAAILEELVLQTPSAGGEFFPPKEGRGQTVYLAVNGKRWRGAAGARRGGRGRTDRRSLVPESGQRERLAGSTPTSGSS